MPRLVVQTYNSKIGVTMNKTSRTEVIDDIIDAISSVSSLQRTGNELVKSKNYRIDVRELNAAGNGAQKDDWKVDIQSNGKGSKTVAVAFLAPAAPSTSLSDLQGALTDSLNNNTVERVT